MHVMVLNDGDTYTDLRGCTIVEIAEEVLDELCEVGISIDAVIEAGHATEVFVFGAEVPAALFETNLLNTTARTPDTSCREVARALRSLASHLEAAADS